MFLGFSDKRLRNIYSPYNFIFSIKQDKYGTVIDLEQFKLTLYRLIYAMLLAQFKRVLE